MFYLSAGTVESNSADHSSHVRYMNGNNGCFSHPILPTEVPGPLQCRANHTEVSGAGLKASDFVLSGDNTGASMHSDFISGWDPEVLADLLRCSKKRSRRSEAGRIFQVPRVVQDPHLSTVSGQVRPKDRVIEDAGALVNEDNGRRLLPGDNGCV
jgi:hypothetical protein